jgi:hypothetical protein
MKIMHNAGIEPGARGEAQKRRIAGLESLDIGNMTGQKNSWVSSGSGNLPSE